MKRYIIGIDEGTTSARVGIYDIKKKKIIEVVQKPISLYYPKPAYVEQDANEIWEVVYSCINEAIDNARIKTKDIISIGITNQRETVVAWSKSTGQALSSTICWQCRRTAKDIDAIPAKTKSLIKNKTGLIPDAYFSATKFKWLLKNNKDVKKAYKSGDLMLGNIDSFIAYKLTGNFVTDTTNASRTMLFNIHTKEWDDTLLKYFEIDKNSLPKVINSNDIVGYTEIYGEKIAVCGILGDQQSALFGQCCHSQGMAKNTYGTGSFLLVNIGNTPKLINNLLTDIAYTINGETTYAIEGSVYNCGGTIEWLKQMNFINGSQEMSNLAKSVTDTNGVTFIPAFTGLASPYWKSDIKASLVGITRGTKKEHVIRACLESIAFRTEDILLQIKKHYPISEIRCDGGVSRNDFVMQFQSDISNVNLVIPCDHECTLLGVIYISGLGMGVYSNLSEISKLWKQSRIYKPNMDEKDSYKKIKQWQKTINSIIKN